MKLRRCIVPRQLLFLLAGLIFIGARPALSQSTITLLNGQTQQVTILGVTPAGIRIQFGDGEMVEPFSNVTQVSMSPPPEYTAAQTAYQSGDLQTALANAQTVVQTYRGLPTDWAREAMLMLGDIDVSLDQLPQAEAAFKDFQAAYPSASSAEVDVGLASVDVANKNYDAAQAKIAPILAQALTSRTPPKEAGALIGRTFLVSGEIKEASGDLQGALEDYLRTVTIFPEDRMAAASAQERADALRKDHGVAVP